jgi:multiple sugar transport system substrate-binding protein
VTPSSVTGETEPPYYSAKEVKVFTAENDSDWISADTIPLGDRVGLLLTIERYEPEIQTRTLKSILYTYDLEGNQLSKADLSSLTDDYSYIRDFQPDGEGNIRALLRTTDENYYQTFETSLEMITLDPSGKEVKPRVDLGTGTTLISDTHIDKEGRIYIAESIVSGSIRIINSDGTALGTIAVDSPNGYFLQIDERLYYDVYESDNRVLYPIDPETQSLGEPIDPEKMRLSSSIETEGGYEIRPDGVFRRDQKTGETTRYMSWDTTYDAAIYSIGIWLPISADKVVGVAGYSESYRISNGVPDTIFLIILTKEATNPDINKKVLVLGGQRIDGNPKLLSAVFRFNRANEEWRIEIRDYLDEVDFAGIEPKDQWDYEKKKIAELITADLLNGEGPDIFLWYNEAFLAPEILERQGYLVDLYALAEGDPSFRKEDYRTNILSLFERDGKLFRFPLSFGLSGLVGPTSLLGDRSGWTIEECTEVLSSLPEGAVAFPNLERKYLLYECLQASLYSFVDYDGKKVNFDSDEFRALLTFADRFGSDPLPETDDSGDIVYPEGFVDPSELALQGNLAIETSQFYNVSELSSRRYFYGEPVTFVGYPSADRSGMTVQAVACMSICETCPDITAAWEFIRLMISEGYQTENPMLYAEPIHIGASQARIERTILSQTGYLESTYVSGTLTDEDADQYIRLLDSASVLNGQDQPIIEIVLEEAAAYFAGVKTAEEVSRIVQDRVTTFVNERG